MSLTIYLRCMSRPPSQIEFDHLLCANLAEASSREWLETNGIGGFASSTIIGLDTRRYHGLLTAATRVPVGRMVLLSKLEETLIIDSARYELSTNQYQGAIHPRGHRYLNSFRLDPFPVFTYRIDGVQVEKSVFLVHRENSVVIQYSLSGDFGSRTCTLEIRPLIAFRDFHSTTHANDAINRQVDTAPGRATVQPYPDLPSLHFAHNAQSVDPTGFWFYEFEYERERERGLDSLEDLYSPFLLRFELRPDETAIIIASTLPHQATEARSLEQREQERRQKIIAVAPARDTFTEILTAAAGQFIVARGEHKSAIAGYHWFGDWGRDTMISLPGLTLVTGRYDDARDILRAFAGSIDQGMLPNCFPDSGVAPQYNTVDATLWMFHAVHEFLRYTRDYDFVRTNLYQPLMDILAWHERGTRYGIRLDSDGLLHAGEPGVQLTWMDAKVGDWVVTPRIGKPVEIQALWYNALQVTGYLATGFGDRDRAAHYTALAERTRGRFAELFWNESEGCLNDVVSDAGTDSSIRPNQIFAVSLPYPLLPPDKALRVVDVVEWELLTPYGLRTLSPRDPNYHGRYSGDPRSRDGAYHQGTVWPWLLGPFLTAYVRVHGSSAEARDRARRFLEPLRDHLRQTGLGQISEVFDGDAPHHPGGCIAQAWSVAEVLRTYVEDALGEERPEFPITNA
ncbi:MAG TPA: amylo-alpha-1,6-glucosidase [Bryobacteraceae bacterium]|nr:amylo-alpha-1,6-glucosidase [Bryobacteraceae bacterium]